MGFHLGERRRDRLGHDLRKKKGKSPTCGLQMAARERKGERGGARCWAGERSGPGRLAGSRGRNGGWADGELGWALDGVFSPFLFFYFNFQSLFQIEFLEQPKSTPKQSKQQ